MAGETGAAKAPVEAQSEPAAKKKFGWWELLNSQASLTLLLAIVGGGWSIYQYVENKQKDDAQFLGSMLPYLTDSKLETRVRAVQIIEARYSPGPRGVDPDDIPDSVKSLMCSSVPDFAESRHQISNPLIISPDAVLDFCQKQENSGTATPTPQGNGGVTPTPSPVLEQTVAAHTRVYIQIYDEEQREGAAEVQQTLQKKGYVVPGIEDLSRTNPDLARKPVGNTEVRYFNAGDATAANEIYDALKNGFPDLNFEKLSKSRPAQSPVRANPGTIEIWFARQDAMKTEAGK